MVDTIKFSQMTNAGNTKNNDVMASLRNGTNVLVNNPWTFLPSGTTAERPLPSSLINYRLRFNTDDEVYEFYNAVLSAWVQLDDTGHLPGPFLTYTADTGLPDAQNLGLLSTGILKQTVTAGSAAVSIADNGVDYYGPGFSGYFEAPAGVKDAYGNKVIEFISAGPTPAAPNYLQLVNAIAGASPSLTAAGSDTDVDASVTPKGTGALQAVTQANGAASFRVISGTGYTHTTNMIFPTSASTTTVTFQDGSGTVAYLSDIPIVIPSALTAANDTNVTITLGGTPATALLQAASITLGWTGTLAPSRGGLGSSSAPTDGQVPVGSGGDYTPTSIGSGTGITVDLAAGSINVALASIPTLNLLANLTGGATAPTPHTLSAIIDACIGSTQGDILYRNATDWSVLAPGTSGFFLQTQGAAANPQWGRGVSGTLTSSHILVGNVSNIATDVAMSGDATIDNTGAVTVASIGGKAVSLAGSFTMAGAFSFTGTLTGATTVTFPTSGTLATTAASVGTLTGDTGVATANAGNINVTGAATGLTFTGASSTLTLEGVLGLANGGTNNTLTASAGGIVWSDASKLNLLAGTATAHQILLSGNAATPVWSTTTYPTTNAINTIMYASSANVLGVISPVNNAVLISSAGGVPSMATTLPSGLTIPSPVINQIVGTNGFPVATFADVASTTDYFSFTAGIANGAIVQLISSGTNASFSFLAKGTGGVLVGSSGATTTPMTWINSTHSFVVSIPTWTANRTLTLPDANVTLVSGTMLPNALTSAHIFVGNGSNLATDVAMSGDASIDNTGALTVSKIGGKAVTLANSFTTVGNFPVTQTYTASTNVTFPTTGTLATLAGSETLTNKTITQGVNAQTGATYVFVASDFTGRVTAQNSSAQTYILPQQSTLTTAAGVGVWLENIGTGTITLVKQGMESLSGNIVLNPGTTAYIFRSTTTAWTVFGGTGSTTLSFEKTFQAVAGTDVRYFTVAAPSPGIIVDCSQVAASLGTAGNYTVAIDGSNVTGLTSVTNTTSKTTTFASANNTFVYGSSITVTFATTVAGVNWEGTLRYLTTLPPPIIPSNLKGLVLWLDANDPAGNTTQPTNNSALAAWVDKSGNANNATQATGAKQPLFKTNTQAGLPAVRFDGVDDFMPTTNVLTVADSTIFVVQKILTVADTRLLFWYGGANQGMYFLNGVDSGAGGNGGTADFSSPVTFIYNSALTTDFYITCHKRVSTAADLYKNGSLQSASIVNSGNIVSAITLGASSIGTQCGNNDICEVLVYNRALSNAELDTINTYLENKWGVG